MKKLITGVTKSLIISITILLFSSCNHILNRNVIEGSGHITTENRIVQGDFKNIEVSSAIDLEIVQSNTTEITVIADDNLQKGIVTTVTNGVLIISCNYNSFNNVGSKKVIVKMPEINGLEASSAATIKSKNVLKGDKISVNSSSASNINLDLEFDSIICESSSGSEINVSGKTLNLNTNASSGSHINAKELLANDVVADVSSGASINVYPILNLNADASSGGNIIYYHIPKNIQKNESSGGSISQH